MLYQPAVKLFSHPSRSFLDESFDTLVTKHFFRESPMSYGARDNWCQKWDLITANTCYR